MTDLLPCPFCGSEAANVRHFGSQTDVFCKNCAALGPLVLRNDEEEAIAAWNRRAPSGVQISATPLVWKTIGVRGGLMWEAVCPITGTKYQAADEDECEKIDNDRQWRTLTPGPDLSMQPKIKPLEPMPFRIMTRLGVALEPKRMKPLGADFEAVWDANVDSLYDNAGLGKEQK